MTQDAILRSLIAENLVSDPAGARGRLLKEAARLFRDKGYERTTVRDLAAAVGIQSGSLFHHFRTKEDILKAVMVETIRLNTALMQAAMDAVDAPRDKLRALIRAELESINGLTGEAMAVLVFEWRSLSEPVCRAPDADRRPELDGHLVSSRRRAEPGWSDRPGGGDDGAGGLVRGRVRHNIPPKCFTIGTNVRHITLF